MPKLKSFWLPIVLSIFSLCLTFYFYPSLPSQVPTQWGFNGQVNSYGSRSTIFLIPVLTLAISLGSWLLPQIDPRRENYGRFSNTYVIMISIVSFFMTALHMLTLTEILRPGLIAMNSLIFTLLSLMFIVFGNYLPKIKHNYFAGIRTAWTLNDEENWYATHRFAGPCWVLGGLCMLACIFLPSDYHYLSFMVVLVIVAVIPSFYSFLFFYRKNKSSSRS